MFWEILGIEPTKEEELIKKAYRAKLPSVNPEDDEEGFKELRRAYEEALAYANQVEIEQNAEEVTDFSYKKKDDVDLWIERIDRIYQDVKTRRDVSLWEKVLHDPICDDLDTELEAAEKLLVYVMGHSYLPQSIWLAMDKRFAYRENVDQLKEKFAENFLDYMQWQMESQTFIDYELFDGKTDSKVDDYINKLYETKSAEEDGDLEQVSGLLHELSAFDVTHPYTEVEKARYYMMKADQVREKAKSDEVTEYDEKALTLMEDLDFEYSDNVYIERTYALSLLKNLKVEAAKQIYETLLEKNPDDFGAGLGIAECTFLEGDPENAKEQVEAVLEDRVQDTECLVLLDRINEVLVKKYTEKLAVEESRDTVIKLGWCYYQQKEFEKGIQLLDKLEEGEDYDYVNLRCRLYLANENYAEAFPYAGKWLAMIEESVDDGTEEMKKRKNRLSLAHFSLGICNWEVTYRNAKETDKEQAYIATKRYIEQAIEEESNTLVRLSYMEQMARFYLEAKSYEACVAVCDRIIAEDRGFFPAYVHRQRANYELRNAKEVIDDYFMCIEIYPEYVPPYILAADVFYNFDQYDDVEQVIQAAAEAGLESDSMEFARIRCIHYKDFSKENVQKALEQIEVLRQRIAEHSEETDIEDLAEVEREYAVLYWDLDNVSRAFAVVNSYLEEHPDSDVMRLFKVDLCLRENQAKEALQIAKKMVAEQPDDLTRRMKLGTCYEAIDKQQKAIGVYEEILNENPDYVPAIRRLMYVYSYMSNRNKDLNLCRKGIEYADRMIALTDSSDAYLEKGNLQIDLYDLEEAVDSCEKAIDRNAEAYYAYNNLGCALLKLRRVEEAVKPLLQAIELDPEREPLPYMNLAECYTLLGEYDKAIEMNRKVLQFRPNAEHVKEDIAKLHMKKGEYDKAIAYYKDRIKAITGKYAGNSRLQMLWNGMDIQEEEQLLSLYCDIADVYRQAGKDDRAEAYYEKVIERWKSPLKAKISCEHLADVAEYYRDKGELEKAENIVRKAYWRCRDENDSYELEHLMFVTASITFSLGKQKKAREDAIGYFTRFYKRNGAEEELLADKRYQLMYLYDYAIMSLCAGDLKEAKEYIDRMEGCNVCVTCECMECFEYYFAKGMLAKVEGRLEEAIEYIEKAIAVKGDYPCAQYQLSTIKK